MFRSTYLTLSAGIWNYRSLSSPDPMGWYITSVVSTIDVCIGLGAEMSKSELGDSDMFGGDSQTNVT